MSRHSSALIVRRRYPETRVREHLVLDYIPNTSADVPSAPKQTKYPCGRGEEGETPIDTAIRELFEETGLRISKRNRRQIKFVHAYREGDHVQYFYTIDHFWCKGRLRLPQKPEQNSKLENLRYESVDVLYDMLHPGPHREAFTLSIREDQGAENRPLVLAG